MLLALALPGCTPDHEVPEEGRYTYRSAHLAPGAVDTMRLLGTLVLTESGAGRLEGHWEGESLHEELVDGEWKGSWYEVESTPTYSGRLVHRIRVGPEGGLLCEGCYSLVLRNENEVSLPLECALWPEGEDAPAVLLPSRGSEAVRNASPPDPLPVRRP